MSFNESLAARCRSILGNESGITEKKMFGGLSFLLEGKMICGVLGERLVVRINPDLHEQMLHQPHVSPMDFTGRPMRGFLYVAPEGLVETRSLKEWIVNDLSTEERPDNRSSRGKGKAPTFRKKQSP